jgi:GxxExxY protein
MEKYSLIKDDYTRKIIGCCLEVHKKLGSGFLEKVYHEALKIELHKKEVPYYSQKSLDIFYDGQLLNCHYIADFVCFDRVIIEIKAVTEISSAHYSQVYNYLKATNSEVGLLINFGAKSLEVRRVTRK